MHPALTAAIVASQAVVAGWAGWFVVRDRPVILRQLWAGAVVEGLFLIQLVTTSLAMVDGRSPSELATWWGYVVTSVLLMPVAALWAFAERTRWSSVVLVVAALSGAVVQWRMIEIWGA